VVVALEDIEHLVARGYLGPRTRLLDIGSQNLLNLTIERARKLVLALRGDPDGSADEIERLCAASIMDGSA
jgi:hypothetical protein